MLDGKTDGSFADIARQLSANNSTAAFGRLMEMMYQVQFLSPEEVVPLWRVLYLIHPTLPANSVEWNACKQMRDLAWVRMLDILHSADFYDYNTTQVRAIIGEYSEKPVEKTRTKLRFLAHVFGRR